MNADATNRSFGDGAHDSAVFFHMRLRPYRSLDPKGFLILMAAVIAANAIAGTIFILRGAWPIFGFCGLDVLALFIAFRVSYHRAQFGETIELDSHALTVRVDRPGGKGQTWRFEPYWVRVQMDDPPRRDSEFALISHGRRLILGRFLTPRERLKVAQGLREALRTRDVALNPASG
jgi:uncharacterized membrane protein